MACDTATLVPEYLRSPLLMGEEHGDPPGAPVDSLEAVVFFEIARCIQRLVSGRIDEADHNAGAIEAIRAEAYRLPPGTRDRDELCEIATALTSTPVGNRRLSATLMTFSDLLYREGRYHEGSIALGLVALIWAGLAVPVVFCLLAIREARLFRKRLLWKHAEKRSAEAMRIAEANGFDHLRAGALHGLALIRVGKGDLPGAKALLDQVLEITEAAGLRRERARAYQDLSMVYDSMGNVESALWANLQAYAIDFGDDEERLHILSDLAVKLVRVGRLQEARLIFEKVLDETPRWSDRTNAVIELMGIDADEKREQRFQVHRQWLAPHISEMPPSMSVDYRVKLAKGLRAFLGPAEAQVPLREALAIAEKHGLNYWIFVVERLLESVHDEPMLPKSAELPLDSFTDRLSELVH